MRFTVTVKCHQVSWCYRHATWWPAISLFSLLMYRLLCAAANCRDLETMVCHSDSLKWSRMYVCSKKKKALVILMATLWRQMVTFALSAVVAFIADVLAGENTDVGLLCWSSLSDKATAWPRLLVPLLTQLLIWAVAVDPGDVSSGALPLLPTPRVKRSLNCWKNG